MDLNYERYDSTKSITSRHESSSYASDVFEDSDLEAAQAHARLHEYFMSIAILISQKRKNIKHQAGACIVNSMNKIVGTGHYTHSNSLRKEVLSWFKDKSKPKKDYLNHAELNAILNKKESDLTNCTMYVTSFPCIECAKMIAQSGISTVVYIEDSCCQTLNDNEIFAAQVVLKLSGVKLLKYR